MGFALVSEVGGEVDVGHAALTDFSFDLVAVRECGFQVFQAVGHRELRWVKQRKLEREWLRPNFAPPNADIH